MSSLWKADVTINERNLSAEFVKPSPKIIKYILCLARDIFPPFKKLPGKKLNTEKRPAIKRTSMFTFRQVIQSKLVASMTVEAAAVLPLLMFFFLNIMSAIEMIRLHGNLELALWESGRRLAVYGYLEQTGKELGHEQMLESWGFKELADLIVPNLAVRSDVIRYVGRSYLEGSPLTYGAEGLNFLESEFLDEEDCIDITVTYQVSPEFSIPGFSSFRMANHSYIRAWTGYELKNEEKGQEKDDYVYVTEYGSVYHESLDCTYLKLSVRPVTLSEAHMLTNSAGESYTLCWICRDDNMDGRVYITDEGNRYHYSLACPSLKRIIHTIKRSEAKRYRPCSRCAAS